MPSDMPHTSDLPIHRITWMIPQEPPAKKAKYEDDEKKAIKKMIKDKKKAVIKHYDEIAAINIEIAALEKALHMEA